MSFIIDYNSPSTDSNSLKFCEQMVDWEIQSILVEFWSSRQYSRFEAPLIRNSDSFMFPKSLFINVLTLAFLRVRLFPLSGEGTKGTE